MTSVIFRATRSGRGLAVPPPLTEHNTQKNPPTDTLESGGYDNSGGLR